MRAVFSVVILFCLGLVTVAAVHSVKAQSIDAPLSVGSAGPVVSATPPVLHDPIANPAAALSDLQQAKKSGWALALFALLVMATRAGVHASTQFKSLAFLAKGRTHIVFAAVGALGIAGYNAIALGGSLYAGLLAAGGAVLYAVLPTPQPTPAVAVVEK